MPHFLTAHAEKIFWDEARKVFVVWKCWKCKRKNFEDEPDCWTCGVERFPTIDLTNFYFEEAKL